MKSFIQKLLILIGLLSLAPAFSYAATVSCTTGYPNDLVNKTVAISAQVSGGAGSAYSYSWTGDDGIDSTGQTINHAFSQEGLMTINVTASSTDSADLVSGSCSVQIYSDATLPPFSASCKSSVDTAVIGQNITWYSTVNGPLGPYSVTWTGDDLNTTATNPQLSYSTSGDKKATMVSFQSRYGSETTIHNGTLSNVTCAAPINIVSEEVHNPSPLVVTGSCAALNSSDFVGNLITWNSNVSISGGASPYQIDWTDNEGSMGNGTSTTKTYTSAGIKSAYLTVEDNAGQSVDIKCQNLSINDVSHSSGGGSYSSGDPLPNSTSTATSTNATSTNSVASNSATSTNPSALLNALASLNAGYYANANKLANGLATTTLITGTEGTSTVGSESASSTNTTLAAAVGLFGISNINWLILAILIILGALSYYFFVARKKKEEEKTDQVK